MILEGIVTTVDPAGLLNIAAMGPEVDAGPESAWTGLVLRPYHTAMTLRNLQETRAGVFHVTDDVDLIARVVVRHTAGVPTRPAAAVPGRILQTTGRYHEFRVMTIDDASERATVRVAIVRSGRQEMDLSGLNRGRFAVVEAAILATRLAFLPPAEVQADLARLAILVRKTGGPAEIRAFERIDQFIRNGTMEG